ESRRSPPLPPASDEARLSRSHGRSAFYQAIAAAWRGPVPRVASSHVTPRLPPADNRQSTSIGEQTNLLALNATVGNLPRRRGRKGLVVVANEVKELAKDIATAEIVHKVQTIQGDAHRRLHRARIAQPVCGLSIVEILSEGPARRALADVTRLPPSPPA